MNEWLCEGGGGGRTRCIVMHGCSRVRPETLASLVCRDGARWVFTDQADTACTKREAPVRFSHERVKLHPTKTTTREEDCDCLGVG